MKRMLSKKIIGKRYGRLIVVMKAESEAEWSREIGINKNTLSQRLRSGWSERDALTKPVRQSFTK